MCIAIVKPAGKSISDDVLQTCFENNADGAGFAYRTEAGLVVVKGLFKPEDFLAAYKERNVNEVDALIHFRITTRGDDSADNTHPFAIKHGALIHNGTIMSLGHARGQGKSDTRVLAEHWNDASLDDMERLFPMFENYVDGTRVAVMGHDGRVIVFNRKQWIEKDGVLYSNRGFEMDVYSYNSYRNPTPMLSTYQWPSRPSAMDWDDEDSGMSAEEQAEWMLSDDNGARDLDFAWVNGRLFIRYNETTVEDLVGANELIAEFTRLYLREPEFGSHDDYILDSMTSMYIDNDFSFDADDGDDEEAPIEGAITAAAAA